MLLSSKTEQMLNKYKAGLLPADSCLDLKDIRKGFIVTESSSNSLVNKNYTFVFQKSEGLQQACLAPTLSDGLVEHLFLH